VSGGISRISLGPGLARLESYDGDGNVVGSVDLEPASKFQPLADGTLLAIRDKDAILLDTRGNEISRARLPAGSGELRPQAHEPLVHRLCVIARPPQRMLREGV
jgi:hypothetical protein